MKKNQFKKIQVYFVVLCFMLSLMTINGFAYAPSTADPIVVDPITKSSTPSGDFEVLKVNDIKYEQAMDVNVNTEPKTKKVMILVDKSSQATTPGKGPLGIFDHALFSKTNTKVSGGSFTLDGKMFTKETSEFHTSSSGSTPSLKITGEAQFSNIIGSTYPLFIGGEVNEAMISNPVKLSNDPNDPNYKAKYDSLFTSTTDDDGSTTDGAILKTITKIQEKANEASLEEGKPYFFPHNYSNPPNNGNDYFAPGVNLQVTGSPGNRTFKILGNGNNLTIDKCMYFDGDLVFSLNGEYKGEDAFIYATGNISFQGTNLSSCKGVYLYSGGSINFEAAASTNCEVVAIAPYGKISVKGNNTTFQGNFIGNELDILSNSSTFKGPSEDQGDVLDEFFPTTSTLDTKSAPFAKKIIDELDSETEVGVIGFGDSANGSDFATYKKSNLPSDYFSYITNITKAGSDKSDSNLGDALRRAYHILNDGNEKTEKYLVVITGLEPNKSTTKTSAVPTSILNMLLTNVSAVNTYENNNLAKEYVKHFAEKIANANVNTIFVDTSDLVTITSENELAGSTTSSGPTANLNNLINHFKKSGEPLFGKFKPNLTPGNTVEQLIDEQSSEIAETINDDSNLYMASDNLNLSTAKFSLKIPKSLNIEPLEIWAGSTKLSVSDLSDSSNYILTANIKPNVQWDASDASIGEYKLSLAAPITVKAKAKKLGNNATASGLKITSTVDLPAGSAYIDYEFEDDTNPSVSENLTVDFDSLTLIVYDVIDIQ